MRNLRENDNGGFDGLLPRNQEWFTPKEVGRIIGRSDQFVRNCLHTGRIFGHVLNGSTRKGEEKRIYMTIHKTMLKLYLIETANYTSDMFLESLKEISSSCNEYQLMVLEKHIKGVLYSGGKSRI